MWCSSASTPQLNIETNDNYYEDGTRRHYAYGYDYQNLVLTFYVDQDFLVKKFFDNWKQSIVPNKKNFRYPDSYTADSLNLYILNQEDKVTYKYEYSRVFPKTIQAIDLSYANGNTIAVFSVEFVFEDVFYSKYNSGVADESDTSKPKPGNINGEVDPDSYNNEVLQTLVDSIRTPYNDSPVDTTGLFE